MNNHILLIEDDQRLASFIVKYLTEQGMVVRHFVNGDNLQSLVLNNHFALIICDVMLPGTDGFEIAKAIRPQFNGSFIFLTALSNTEHQLKGFELGADDYITKPVDPEVLLARIKACLRRREKPLHSNIIKVANLTVNKNNRVALVDQQQVALSRYEFDLLWLLASHSDQQVSREFLFVNTVGREYDGLDRTVDGRVSRLRKKLETYQNLKCKIDTLWGQGYMLSVRD